MSGSAVRRIQPGMACSEHGAISRLSTIAHASWHMCSGSLEPQQNTLQIETLPELEADMDRTSFTMLSVVTREGSTVISAPQPCLG